MFDEISSDDGSGIGFSNHNGDACEGIDCEVREDDEVELTSEGAKISAMVTNITGNSVTGQILALPFGADLELELGDVVEFTLSNINQCSHP